MSVIQPQVSHAHLEDAAVGAHLVLLSGPSAFSYGLAMSPAAAEQLVGELWPYPGHLFSYQWAHLAVAGGVVQGLILGYPGARIPAAGLATGRLFVRRFRLGQLLRMARNGWDLLRVSAWVGWRDYYIGHLAVLPEAEGRGIGRRLLAHAEEVARRAGCTRMALDVFIENERARALYERTGYMVSHMARNPRLQPAIGYSGLVRMVKPL